MHIVMAKPSISTTLVLFLLLTLASGQVNPGSYDKVAEQGWNNFVKEAAKKTGGTPIQIKEFVTRDNNNLGGGDAGEADRKLMEELRTFNVRKDLTSIELNTDSMKPHGSEQNFEPTVTMDHTILPRTASSLAP